MLQMTAISFAAILGVYAAATVIEDVLVKHMLISDSGFLLERGREESADAAAGDTYMTGYLEKPRRRRGETAGAVPRTCSRLSPRQHNGIDARRSFPTVRRGRLYLGFDQAHVSRARFRMSLSCG